MNAAHPAKSLSCFYLDAVDVALNVDKKILSMLRTLDVSFIGFYKSAFSAVSTDLLFG